MTKANEGYQYNYKPKGDHADAIITWLKAQKQKSDSLDLLIQQAIRVYGPTTDLKDYMINQFLNGHTPTQPETKTTEPVSQPAPKPAPTQPAPKPAPQTSQPNFSITNKPQSNPTGFDPSRLSNL